MSDELKISRIPFSEVMSEKGFFNRNAVGIVIPPFQRSYMWKARDCAGLVDSILSVAFQNIATEVANHGQANPFADRYDGFTANMALANGCDLNCWQFVQAEHDGEDDDEGVVHIIDGQQRITTLLLMTRALVLNLIRFYDKPHLNRDGNQNEAKVAATLIHNLLHVLSVHTGSSQPYKTDWGKVSEPVLVSEAIDDLDNEVLSDILTSGLTVRVNSNSSYDKNYHLFMSMFASPEWTGYGDHIEVKADDEKGLSYPSTISIGSKQKIDVAAYRELFYTRIDSDWSEPERVDIFSFKVISETNKQVTKKQATNGEGIPFILYFAFTLLHNVFLILQEFDDEESGLRYFELTNTTGYKIEAIDRLKAYFYGAYDSEQHRDQFIKTWTLWHENILKLHSGLGEQANTSQPSRSLLTALTYFNLTSISKLNTDGPSTNLVRYALVQWPQQHDLTPEHVDKTLRFLSLYEQVAAWFQALNKDQVDADNYSGRPAHESKNKNLAKTFQGKSAVGQTEFSLRDLFAQGALSEQVEDSEEFKWASLYVHALTLLEDDAVLVPLYLYFVHFMLIKQRPVNMLKFLRKYVANQLYRTLFKVDFSVLNIGRNICETRYLDGEYKYRQNEFDLNPFKSMQVFNKSDQLLQAQFAEVDGEQTLEEWGDELKAKLLEFSADDYNKSEVRFILYCSEIAALEQAAKAEKRSAKTSSRSELASDSEVLQALDLLTSTVCASSRAAKVRIEKYPAYFPNEVVQVDIEHISPQSNKQKKNPDTVNIQKLGNLFLLEHSLNARASNNRPERKISAYKESVFYLAQTADEDFLRSLKNGTGKGVGILNATDDRADALVEFFISASTDYWAIADEIKGLDTIRSIKKSKQTKGKTKR